MQSKTCIIMPAYNEADSIKKVIRTIQKKLPKVDIIVINDGSSDNTSQLAQQMKVVVINLPFNLGIGGAVQTGLKYASIHNYDRAVQVDADGQHDPRDVKKLLSTTSKEADLIIGSRFVSTTAYKGTVMRNFGTGFFSVLIVLMTGKKIYDTTSGYRVYNERAIAYLSKNYPVDFPEPESLLDLLKQGFTIKEVSVNMRPRQAGVSSIRSLKSWYLVISITLSLLVSAFRTKKKYVA